MSLLPVKRAHLLADHIEAGHPWLIEGLWSEEAVGIVGGEPKLGKSWLALDMAVSVAAGIPCLRRFPVTKPGRVLVYSGEDPHYVVQQRLENLCAAAGVNLPDLDIQVITAPTLRLDLKSDGIDLEDTVRHLQPRLLLLDPFVRLHRADLDENSCAEVAPLLAYLRELQRRHHLAVALVHHAKKDAGRTRAGQALRGSGEFHAWVDSLLYLRRLGQGFPLRVELTIEHRAAPSRAPLVLELPEDEEMASFFIVDRGSTPEPPPSPASVDERITRALAAVARPLRISELRSTCRVRNATLYERLAALTASGTLVRSADGYRIANPLTSASAQQQR